VAIRREPHGAHDGDLGRRRIIQSLYSRRHGRAPAPPGAPAWTEARRRAGPRLAGGHRRPVQSWLAAPPRHPTQEAEASVDAALFRAPKRFLRVNLFSRRNDQAWSRLWT